LIPLNENSVFISPKYLDSMGRDSVIGKATRYGLDDLEIELLLWQVFTRPTRPALGTT
jgi:hypothetical protein